MINDVDELAAIVGASWGAVEHSTRKEVGSELTWDLLSDVPWCTRLERILSTVDLVRWPVEIRTCPCRDPQPVRRRRRIWERIVSHEPGIIGAEQATRLGQSLLSSDVSLQLGHSIDWLRCTA
jgi:hypothetical protein